MRDTFEWIDGATEKHTELRHALYDLAAHQIASQALPIALATLAVISEDNARTLVEKVAGYPGITGRKMAPVSDTRVGDRATEILLRLVKLKRS